MGYTGVALKACKGQTQIAAAGGRGAEVRAVPVRAGPDLLGRVADPLRRLAAHVPGVAAIESNGRQYCPAANAPWDAKFPGMFTITDGTMNTADPERPGAGRGVGSTVTQFAVPAVVDHLPVAAVDEFLAAGGREQRPHRCRRDAAPATVPTRPPSLQPAPCTDCSRRWAAEARSSCR